MRSKCDTCIRQEISNEYGHLSVFCGMGYWDGDESIYSKLENDDYNSLWDNCKDYKYKGENKRGFRAKLNPLDDYCNLIK